MTTLEPRVDEVDVNADEVKSFSTKAFTEKLLAAVEARGEKTVEEVTSRFLREEKQFTDRTSCMKWQMHFF